MYQLNAAEYQRIGAPQQVIDWIVNGAKLPFVENPAPCFHQNRVFRWFKFTLKPPYSIAHDKL